MTNEAAERLMERIRVFHPADTLSIAADDMDAALAAERKATVERYEPMLSAFEYVQIVWESRHVKPEWMTELGRAIDSAYRTYAAVLDAEAGGLLPTDLTLDNSAKRGRRDALRHEAGE